MCFFFENSFSPGNFFRFFLVIFKEFVLKIFSRWKTFFVFFKDYFWKIIFWWKIFSTFFGVSVKMRIFILFSPKNKNKNVVDSLLNILFSA